jgi:hypothetical protein
MEQRDKKKGKEVMWVKMFELLYRKAVEGLVIR